MTAGRPSHSLSYRHRLHKSKRPGYVTSVLPEFEAPMPRANLSAVSIERLKRPDDGQIEYYDRRFFPASAFALSYHGSRSWFLLNCLDGRLIRVTLGRYPALSLADAREEARKAACQTAEGKDPRVLKAEAKQKHQAERRNTFAACASEFLCEACRDAVTALHAARVSAHSNRSRHVRLAGSTHQRD